MQNFAPDYGGVGLDPALVLILSAVALVVPPRAPRSISDTSPTECSRATDSQEQRKTQ